MNHAVRIYLETPAFSSSASSFCETYFFFFHLKSLKDFANLSFSPELARFASLLENKLFKLFLPKGLFLAIIHLKKKKPFNLLTYINTGAAFWHYVGFAWRKKKRQYGNLWKCFANQKRAVIPLSLSQSGSFPQMLVDVNPHAFCANLSAQVSHTAATPRPPPVAGEGRHAKPGFADTHLTDDLCHWLPFTTTF